MLLDMHVLPTVKDLNAYSSKKKTILEKLMEVLAEKNFFEPINLNEYLSSMTKHNCYVLIKKLKMHELTLCFIQPKLFWSIRQHIFQLYSTI